MLGGGGGLGMSELQPGLLDLRVRSQHALENSHRNRVPEVVLQQHVPLARVGQVGRLDGRGRDIRTDPELGLRDHTVVGDLETLQRLSETGVNRLREREAVGLWVEDRRAVDGRIPVVGIDVQTDKHLGARQVHAVPALRYLDVLVTAARQHHLHLLSLQQGTQPEGQVEGDVLLHEAADHHAGIPELGRVAGRTAPMSRIDGDHIGRGHDKRGLRSRCPSRWHGHKQDDPGRKHGREARETQLLRSIRREIKKS